MRCAKTTVLEWLQNVVYKPLSPSNVTPARVFKWVDNWFEFSGFYDLSSSYAAGEGEALYGMSILAVGLGGAVLLWTLSHRTYFVQIRRMVDSENGGVLFCFRKKAQFKEFVNELERVSGKRMRQISFKPSFVPSN